MQSVSPDRHSKIAAPAAASASPTPHVPTAGIPHAPLSAAFVRRPDARFLPPSSAPCSIRHAVVPRSTLARRSAPRLRPAAQPSIHRHARIDFRGDDRRWCQQLRFHLIAKIIVQRAGRDIHSRSELLLRVPTWFECSARVPVRCPAHRTPAAGTADDRLGYRLHRDDKLDSFGAGDHAGVSRITES